MNTKSSGIFIFFILLIYPIILFFANGSVMRVDVVLGILLAAEMLVLMNVGSKNKWYYISKQTHNVYNLNWQSNMLSLFTAIVAIFVIVYFSSGGLIGIFSRLLLLALPAIWIGLNSLRKSEKYPNGTFKVKNPLKKK